MNAPFEKLSSEDFLLAAGILILAFVVARLIRGGIKKYMDGAADNLRVDPTHYAFFQNVITSLVMILAFLVIIYTIPTFKSLALTLLAGAGVFAAVLGLASQQAFSNIVGGLFIVVFKPIRVGDLVNVAEYSGIVEDINLRHTIIRTFDNRRVIIPNSTISSSTVVNHDISDPVVCNFIVFNISYDSDIDLAMKIIREEAEAHPNILDHRSPEDVEAGEPVVRTKVVNLGDFSVDIRAWCWSADWEHGWELKLDLLKAVKQRFDREGVEIPYPHRSLVFKQDLTKGKRDDV